MDRQDIDALLIGALYGELTPADEARLAAHLESHPADRSALDGLKVARDAVKQSRIFDVQAEPPQAISAVLLQEAARRAPKLPADPERREGWFQRFVRSFASHPAMAAAAMLVVVVGIAGTLYMRGGDRFAEKTAGAPSETAQNALDTTRPEAPGAVAANEGAAVSDAGTAATGAAGSAAYGVGLADEQVAKDVPKKQEEVARTETKPEPKLAKKSAADDGEFAKAPAAHGAPKKGGYLEVTTPDRAPKEMDSKNDAYDTRQVARGEASGESLGGAGGAPAGPATNAPETVAAAPPPPPADQPRPQATPAPAKTVSRPAQGKVAAQEPPPQAAPAQPPPTNTTLLAWAKQQHADAVARVKKGDCSGAATIAASVRSRAPDYFAQNMRDDRELKSCTAYINDAVDKDERSKAKATKRATTDAK